MSSFTKLTHLVGGKKTDLYVHADQICRLGDSVGGDDGYQANFLLANQQVDVCETVADVMNAMKAADA